MEIISYHWSCITLLSNDIIDLLWETSLHLSMIFNYLENHCDHSFHPYDSLYINYHMYISINRFLFVFHPLIWIVTMIIRYDLICDCIIINYQILSPFLISIILLFSLFNVYWIHFHTTLSDQIDIHYHSSSKWKYRIHIQNHSIHLLTFSIILFTSSLIEWFKISPWTSNTYLMMVHHLIDSTIHPIDIHIVSTLWIFHYPSKSLILSQIQCV